VGAPTNNIVPWWNTETSQQPTLEHSHKKAQKAQNDVQKNHFVPFVLFCGFLFCGPRFAQATPATDELPMKPRHHTR
jgi:hypothetical protein